MKISREVTIGKKRISLGSPTYFIADIASNHDGDLERAKELIYLAADSGADAAKFQHFKAETIVSEYGFENLGAKLSHQGSWEKSVYETYEDASLDSGWTPVLKEACDKAGISFFTSPYSRTLVDEVEPYVPAYKIGSGDITFLEIIAYMASKNKPIILSTGASTLADVERAVESILEQNDQLVLLQCNTNYTGPDDNFRSINLNVLRTYSERFPGMILGLSDHTQGCTTVLGAIALGATVIEKHLTDNNGRGGPDHSFSMTPTTWREMVDRSRELEDALGSGTKQVEENEKETALVQRRCLRLSRGLEAGVVLSEDDLIALRPAVEGGFEPYRLSELIGSRLTVSKVEGDAILEKEIRQGE